MTAIEESIDIRAPTNLVFAEVTDPRRAPEWNPNVVEVRNVSGRLEPGASWEQVVKVMGRNVDLTCRVVRYEPPTYGEVEISGGQRGRVWTRCEERTGMTRVTQGIDFTTPGGMLGAALGGVVTGMMRRELSATMARQRDALEREAGGIDAARS